MIGKVDIRSPLQQQTDKTESVVEYSLVKWCDASVVLRIDVEPDKQSLGPAQVSTLNGVE